jgi:CheY-like chemotaxis protein
MLSEPEKDRINLKSLIVDDHCSIRVILEEMLKPYSSDILSATNGREAVSGIPEL